MKKLLTILLLIMLIISLFQVANMYALYKAQIQGDYINKLGIWSIKVNGVDISSGGENLTFTMTDDNLTYLKSEHVKNNKMAPGTQAYFEIIVDPTNTDVSILYTLDIKLAEIDTAKLNLVKVENYFQKDGETEQITNTDVNTDNTGSIHQGIMKIDKINEKYLNHIKVYFEWENIEENNGTDSELGQVEGNKINIPLEINIKQYTGEVISNGT